jgi:hypothetical protein
MAQRLGRRRLRRASSAAGEHSMPLYALRSRIECFTGHLKEERRIATRCFFGSVLLGCIRI